MRTLALVITLVTTFSLKGKSSSADSIIQGVYRMDTVSAYFDVNVKGHYIFKEKEIIGFIAPEIWFSDQISSGNNPLYIAEFYPFGNKDTLMSLSLAKQWIGNEIKEYYQPVKVADWRTLDLNEPKAQLTYPYDWTYKVKNQPVFGTKTAKNNQVILTKNENNSISEIIRIIRTPNSANLSLDELISETEKMIPSIQSKINIPVEVQIGNKKFLKVEHEFVGQMLLVHIWHADAEEIIYINSALLKDDRFRYPDVVEYILSGIKW